MKKSKKIVLIVISCIVVLATIAGVIFGIVMNQPASVVTKFEEKRAEEIASFKEKKPGYIVDADNRAGYVQVIFMIHSSSSMTPEKFAKKHDLKTLFPKAEVKVSEYSTVTLNFKRNDYTKAVHNALTKLSKEDNSVYPIHPHVYAGSSIKYKPDISLHAKNPTKLEYTVLDEKALQPKGFLFDEGFLHVDRMLLTKEDYDTYIDMLVASVKSEEHPEVIEAFQKTMKDKYDKEFFEANALLVTKEMNGSVSVDNVYLSKDNKVYVVIRTSDMGRTSGYMFTDMISESTFHIAVSKDAINGATELITLD